MSFARLRRKAGLGACSLALWLAAFFGVPGGGFEAQAMQEAPAKVVVETMDSGDYTYAKIEAGGDTYWVAAPRTAVKVGDRVEHPQGAVMRQFESKTLKRTFDSILFVDRLVVAPDRAKASETVTAAHSGVQDGGSETGIEAGSIAKAAGGYTVAELYERAKELAGKEVSVRGKVVKFNGSILGRNWIHLRDGTGSASANDVTVTSGDAAAVGEVVLVTGTLALDKDFGSGYRYPVIIEGASLSREN